MEEGFTTEAQRTQRKSKRREKKRNLIPRT
jgi:hypothetical protein